MAVLVWRVKATCEMGLFQSVSAPTAGMIFERPEQVDDELTLVVSSAWARGLFNS